MLSITEFATENGFESLKDLFATLGKDAAMTLYNDAKEAAFPAVPASASKPSRPSIPAWKVEVLGFASVTDKAGNKTRKIRAGTEFLAPGSDASGGILAGRDERDANLYRMVGYYRRESTGLRSGKHLRVTLAQLRGMVEHAATVLDGTHEPAPTASPRSPAAHQEHGAETAALDDMTKAQLVKYAASTGLRIKYANKKNKDEVRALLDDHLATL